MIKTVESLVGKEVKVTLRATLPAPVKGKLIECDQTFLAVEQENGAIVIPLTSVLHLVAMPVRVAN